MRGYVEIWNEAKTRFVKWFAGAEKSPMFQGKNKEAYIKLFQTLLIKASWQDIEYEQNGRSFKVQKGEVITKYADLAKASNLKVGQVRRALSRFEKDGAIESPPGIHGVGKTIFIVNYANYQEKYKEHPKKHYYCPEVALSEMQQIPKEQKNKKTAEVLKPQNKLEILINRLTNEPSLVDKLLLAIEILDNQNGRSSAEEEQNFNRSSAEVCAPHIYSTHVFVKEDKKNNRLKEKESKKKKTNELFSNEEKEVNAKNTSAENTIFEEKPQENPLDRSNFHLRLTQFQTEELPQEIIKAYLLAIGKIKQDTTGPFKTAIRDNTKAEVISFFNEKTLSQTAVEYLFKSAREDIRLKAKPENRDEEHALGYLFKRISEETFFNKAMSNFQKETKAIEDKKPKEEITLSLEITEEVALLNKKMHQDLQIETKHLGRIYQWAEDSSTAKSQTFYEACLKDKIFVGGYDEKKRIVRLHFSSMETYKHFTGGINYQAFLFRLFGLNWPHIEIERKNMAMLPCYEPSKIIHWKYQIQGDLFLQAKSEDEKLKIKEKKELEIREKLMAIGLLLSIENHKRFGYVRMTGNRGVQYEAYSRDIRI